MNPIPDTLRIPLPEALRERILAYRGALETLLAEHKRLAQEAPDRLASLESSKDAVSSELHRLHSAGSPDDTGVIEQISKLETRLRVILAQLDSVRETVAGIAAPPRFNSAGDILQLIRGLTAYWREALLPMIAAQLRPFCADEREAHNLACRTEAVQSLSRLRDSWVWRRTESATPGNVESLNRILDRALRGQPALTFEGASPEPPTTTGPEVQPDSPALGEQLPGTAEAETRPASVLVNDSSLFHVANPRCGRSAAPGNTFTMQEAIPA